MGKVLETYKTPIGAGLLLAAGVVFLNGVSNHIDLSWYDEPFYQKNGADLLINGWPNANWGPLYALWYRILYIFFPEPLDLYYANIYILTIAIAVLGYIALRVWNVSWLVSFLFGYFLLISDLNVYVFPKPVHASLLFIWVGFIGLRYAKNILVSFFVMSTTVLIIAYIRPEFYLAFLLLMASFFILNVYYTIKISEFNWSIKTWGLFGSVVCVALLFGWSMGWPFLSDLGNPERSFLAFTQHFAIHYFERNQIVLDPFFECNRLWSLYLPGVHSIMDCIRLYPFEFFLHVFSNVKLWFTQGRLLFYHNAIFLPSHWPLMAEASILVILFSVYVFFLSMKYKAKISIKISRVCFIVLLILIPSVISNLLVFPRLHYVLFILVLVVFWVLVLVSNYENSPLKESGFIYSLAIASMLLIFVPNHGTARFLGSYHLQLVKLLKRLPLNEDDFYLDSGAGYAYFAQIKSQTDICLGDNRRPIIQNIKNGNYDVIFVDYNLIQRVMEDPDTFKLILHDFKRKNYIGVGFFGRRVYLLVNLDWLNKNKIRMKDLL